MAQDRRLSGKNMNGSFFAILPPPPMADPVRATPNLLV
jgi:hypothetical protein